MPDAVTFHDALAPTWESRYQSHGFQQRLQVVSTLLPPGRPGQCWLDAGCGTGTLSRWLAREHGFSVESIDASEKMLENALPAPGVTYSKREVSHTGFPDASFDGVLCSSVLEYIPAIDVALGEFHRLLKPGGVLLVSLPNSAWAVRMPLKLAYWLTWPLRKKRMFRFLDYSVHAYSQEKFADLLGQNGFRTERMVEFGKLGLPLTHSMRTKPLIMALATRIDPAAKVKSGDSLNSSIDAYTETVSPIESARKM